MTACASNVTFLGVSGLVKFEKSGDPMKNIRLDQIQGMFIRFYFFSLQNNILRRSLIQICDDKMTRDMTKPTMWLCAQRRLRSALASAQSDQSLRCPHSESLGP